MSNRSKKAQFSRSLKKKSIHIGGKSEKVTPPPLKKPTSVLDNCSPAEIHRLEDLIEQRLGGNLLFFRLKQMADFLEKDINQFNLDLQIPEQKLSISEKIISPQEHFLCEKNLRETAKLVRRVDHSDYTSTLNYIKEGHNVITTLLNEFIDNNVYKDWAAAFLPIFKAIHYMTIKELGWLKQHESYVAYGFNMQKTSNVSLSTLLFLCENVIATTFLSFCQFAPTLKQIVILRQFNNGVSVNNMSIPSSDVYVSFDDCFDTNCSTIDVDNELSQLDLRNDPLLEQSLRDVYYDFNGLIHQQRVAQKQAIVIDSPIEGVINDERSYLDVEMEMTLLSKIELLAYINKFVDQNKKKPSKLNDEKLAYDFLHGIINDQDPFAVFFGDGSPVLAYQLRSIALLAKERAFYANITAEINNCLNNVQQADLDPVLFKALSFSLLDQDQGAHLTNIHLIEDVIHNDLHQYLGMVSNIDLAATTANLFEVITRITRCFIADDYAFARFIVDAYHHKPNKQTELDKLLNEAQLKLDAKLGHLKA